jgi:addiction module HigA family antidote
MVNTESLHPGVYVRQECLVPHGLSVKDAAFVLGVSRQALSNLLGGHAGISAEMAIRLAKVFGLPAEVWLQRQLAYDLAQAYQAESSIAVRSLSARPPRAQQPELF